MKHESVRIKAFDLLNAILSIFPMALGERLAIWRTGILSTLSLKLMHPKNRNMDCGFDTAGES